MVAGCGNNCVKYLFFSFNFLFFVLGAMLLVMSIWVRLDNDFQTKLNDAIQKSAGTPVELYQMYIVLYLLATIGGLLCLTGFLGCCGACSESPCLLALFFTVVLALFLTKIALTIYIFVKKDTLKRELSGWFNNNVFSHYHNENNTDIQKIIDQIQTKFDCCGANGCKDFLFPEIPSTCNCDQNQEGCIDKVFTELRKYMVLLVGVTITVLAVEFLAMVFSCIILDAIRNNANDYAYY